jgi:hypothetical protein
MKKRVKKIIQVVVIIIVILILLWALLWYLEKEGYIEGSIFGKVSLLGFAGYGYGDDPCYHEPNEPDPCGPS